MIQLTNMIAESPETSQISRDAGSVKEYVRSCGCGGIEIIYSGSGDFCNQNREIITGYHLMFYGDWLDFWNGDTAALNRKFGSEKIWREFFGGGSRDEFVRQFHADLQRADAIGVKYVVFHVSDVSDEETFTYRWEHTDEEVVDGAAELINTLLDGQNYRFEFLLENLPWPGLDFTRPEITARLLSKVNYRDKGIMLDTGHLMCTNPDIRNQDDGFRYIQRMLDEHGTLCSFIRGVHLHQSVTGEYVKRILANPPEMEGGCYKRFAQSYEHICRIDTHQPVTGGEAYRLLERLAPEYLVHELKAKTPEEKRELIRLQQKAVMKGSTL
jgi:hypothetical protein